MLKKIAIVGSVIAVAGLGVGGVASAWSGAPAAQASVAASTAPTTTPTNPSTTGKAGKAGKAGHTKKRAALAKRLERVSHAQWVTKDGKTGTFVTHDAVRGDVTAASTTSITIKATDGTSETFTVNGSTKVRVAGTTGAMSGVKVGDRAAVLGTGSGSMTATRVIDRGAPGSHSASAGTKHRAGKAGAATPGAPATTGPSTTTPTTTAATTS